MAEKQILAFGTRSVPFNRTIKDSEHFFLLALNANFDGSGAGNDYCPTVTILSDSGDVVGRFPTTDVVAAGDDAEVTFAPFLRHGGPTLPTGARSFEAWYERVTVPAASDTHFQFSGNVDFGADLFDAGGGAFNPRARKAGVYSWSVWTGSTSVVANKVGTVILDVDTGNHGSPQLYRQSFGQDFPLDGGAASLAEGTVSITRYLLEGSDFDVTIQNSAGVSVDFDTYVVVQVV